tara:strand:+ start:323 stop:916 length:594 start_codon:yes stop_codon:yes gene_type:complete
MKKVLIISFVIMSLNLFSQNFTGGLIGGISTSQVSGDNLGGYHKAGLFLGVFTQLPINQISNLKMEMNFIQKGSNNPKMLKNGISDISTSYLEIPVSAHYYQTEITSFEIGGQIAFLITSTDNDIYGAVSSELINPFNKVDIGAFIGMSHHLTDKILLNSRMSNSILPVRPHASGAIYKLNRGQYNSVLSFTLHYII